MYMIICIILYTVLYMLCAMMYYNIRPTLHELPQRSRAPPAGSGGTRASAAARAGAPSHCSFRCLEFGTIWTATFVRWSLPPLVMHF